MNISSGTVLTNAAGALGTGGLTVGSGATLTVNGSNGLTGAVQINGATVLANSAGALGSGALSVTSGTLTTASAMNNSSASLSGGQITFANGGLGVGGVTLSGGILQWAAGNTQDVSAHLALVNSTTATLDTQSNNVAFATAFGGSTSATLVKVGVGTLTLNGADTYTGGTVINAGEVAASVAAALGTGPVQVNGGTLAVAANLSVSGGTLNNGQLTSTAAVTDTAPGRSAPTAAPSTWRRPTSSTGTPRTPSWAAGRLP